MHRKNEGRDIRYTPLSIVKAIQAALDTHKISLDPCGSDDPEKQIATRTITEDENGLKTRWRMKGGKRPRTIYVNPPGTLIRPFADRFVDAMIDRKSKGAFLVFNHDHSTRYWHTLVALDPVCVVLLDRRYRFRDGNNRLFEVGRSHSIVFANVDPWRVDRAFEKMGLVWAPIG